jgi:hypothetical protein
MPAISTSSGTRQPIVALRARAMISVTTPEMTSGGKRDEHLQDELVDTATVEQTRGGREQARADGAPEAGDEVDADDVERVVVAEA